MDSVQFSRIWMGNFWETFESCGYVGLLCGLSSYSPPSINVTLINVNSLYLLTNRTPLTLLIRMLTMLNVNNNILPSLLICHL